MLHISRKQCFTTYVLCVFNACSDCTVLGIGIADWTPCFRHQPVNLLDNWQHVADDVCLHCFCFQSKRVRSAFYCTLNTHYRIVSSASDH